MGEGVYAYCIEYKTMMMMLLSLLSSLVSLHCACATLLTATCSHSPVESFMALGPWVCILLLSVGVVTLSFVGAAHLTAVVGGLHCCWVVNVVCWVLAVACRLLSSLHVVVNWAVVVLWVAGFVCGGGGVTWQQATGRAHALPLMLVTWACGCCASLSRGCRGLWAARDVYGGGCYEWATWWWLLWDEEGSHVTVCDAFDFWIMNARTHSHSCSCPNLHCPYHIQFHRVYYTIL